MRDIELTKAPLAIPDAAIDDKAYARPPAGGVFSDTTATDPSRTDSKAYFKVSLGGEFGPARSALLSQPADGGVANLAAATTVIVTPPVRPTPPNPWTGRAMNNTSVLNLYPWRKVPPQGLDQNNPYA
jgi:hypothetical protein